MLTTVDTEVTEALVFYKTYAVGIVENKITRLDGYSGCCLLANRVCI